MLIDRVLRRPLVVTSWSGGPGSARYEPAASRIFLSSHVDLQGIAALEDCWREVTGTATPAPILSYFEARAATRENRKDVAALRKQATATASLADMREFTLRDLRRAVQEYRATRQPPG